MMQLLLPSSLLRATTSFGNRCIEKSKNKPVKELSRFFFVPLHFEWEDILSLHCPFH